MRKLQTFFKAFLCVFAIVVFAHVNANADSVYKTALFGSAYNSKTVSSYTDEWYATNDGFMVRLNNFNNNNSNWSYVKCGRKNNASVATITAGPIDKAISKVVVTIDAITVANVNSAKVLVSSNADMSSAQEVVASDLAVGEVTFDTSSKSSANQYYQLVFDCKSATGNGFVQISKVEYYIGGEDPEPVGVEPVDFSLAEGSYPLGTELELSCETEGATIYYTVGDGDLTEYTEAIVFDTKSDALEVSAYAVVGEDESEVTTKTYKVISAVAPVAFSVPAGTYSAPFDLELTCATEGASIYYSFNGVDFEEYTSAINIATACTVTAYAQKDTDANEPVSAEYSFLSTNVVFYESFDKCAGTGGNDGQWSGSIASSKLVTDNEGWTVANAAGADKCAKFGASSKAGSALTPALGYVGDATLTFMAGAWVSGSEKTTIAVTVENGGEISESEITLVKGAWTSYTLDLTNLTEDSQIKFEAKNASANRFFLDEVTVTKVVKANVYLKGNFNDWSENPAYQFVKLDGEDTYKLKTSIVPNGAQFKVFDDEKGNVWLGSNGNTISYKANYSTSADGGAGNITFADKNTEAVEMTFYYHADTNVLYIDSEATPVLASNLYVIGQVNNIDWDPAQGVEMQMGVFNGETGFHVEEIEVTGDGYFVFASQLGDWGTVNANRYGPASNAEEPAISTPESPVFATLNKNTTDYAFFLTPGKYKMTVSGDLTKLYVEKVDEGTGVESIATDKNVNRKARKVMENNELIIEDVNGNRYNAQGGRIK